MATAGALWLARRPIFDALAQAFSFNEQQGDEAETDGEPADAAVRCQTY